MLISYSRFEEAPPRVSPFGKASHNETRTLDERDDEYVETMYHGCPNLALLYVRAEVKERTRQKPERENEH